STYMSIVKNGVVVGSIATSAGTLPLVETYLNTFNNNGTPSTRRNASPIAAWGSFGSGLTAQQEIDLNAALYLWQTQMERREGLETKQVVVDGNSHTVYQLTKMFWTVQMNLICQGWKFTNLGVSGQTLTQMLADFASEVAPLYNGALTKNVFLLYEGTNEMHVNGATVTDTINLMISYVNAVHALGASAKIVVKKNFCRQNPSSGPGLVTYPNVTAWNLAVDELNTRIAAGETGADIVSDVSSSHFIPRSNYASDGAYNTAVAALIANVTEFVDLTHLTMAGYKTEGDLDTTAIQLA
ncbi:MAG TPA: SGNH/GDSL hydrolase family protein, partial [Chitinophagaceae bacterium]